MKRGLFIIFASVAAILCFTMCRQAQPETSAVQYAVVEEKPVFMYGEPNSFVQWVNSELRYPQEAMEKGITGKVTVVFTIAKDGSVTSTKVTECSYPELEKEALRVIAKSPKWTPGKSNGEPVDVQYILPIVFDNKKAKVPGAGAPTDSDSSYTEPQFVSPDTGKNSHTEFTKWYFYRVKYPDEAKKEGIQGRGKIAFEITVTGDLENVRIVQGAHPLLDSAAIKVVRNSPRWKPATKDGVPIKTTFIFPYVFQLR